MKRFVAALCAFSFLVSGCATIVRGTHQRVLVGCDAPAAKVDADATGVPQDPGAIPLERGTPHLIYVKADGYEQKTVHVFSRVNWWWFCLDLIFLPSLVVDAFDGAIDTLDPDPVEVKLLPLAWPKGPERWPAIDASTGKAKAFCPYCGAPTPENAKFCPVCGKEQ